MKKQIIILGLGIYFIGYINAFAYNNYYNPYYSYQTPLNRSVHYYNNYYNRHNPYYIHYNNAYYPYCRARNYNSSYYNNYYNNQYNPYTMEYSRLKHIRDMKKIKRKTKNKITWLSKNNGALTGYSVPIQKNSINGFFNQKLQPITSSPTCNTDLWDRGNGSSNNGISGSSFGKFNSNNQTGAKTGVTIIYD